MLRSALRVLRPPPRLTLSQWADAHFYLSAESAAEQGRWKTLPYQRGVMDAITDPRIERVSIQKSARVGFTKIINAAIGYYIHQDPCPVMVVQPTVEDAKGYSKEEIMPMLRDCDVLARLVGEQKARAAGSTILAKMFPGGSLTMVGANSGRGFRRVSRRVVIFDEVDGYPPSAGSEGDQIKLGIQRTAYYWNRKIVAGSTPLLAGSSRIADMFLAGDQRRYHVPCPHCGHRDFLSFRERADGRGHFMQWPDGKPEGAYFVCRGNGCIIEHRDKFAMVEAGEWIADAPLERHASFHIWAAYSYSPSATWGSIATEFTEATRGGSEKLRVFVNTVLGETWQDKGESPDWERIYARRERYQIGTVPAGVVAITAGVDVQKDRLVAEVVGWARTKESWSIEYVELHGDTAAQPVWAQLDALLARTYQVDGTDARMAIGMLAIDSGYNTQQVYNWARRHGPSRAIPVKGVANARVLLGVPSAVDVLQSGKRIRRGHRVWPVGVDVAKGELYGWLRLPPPEPGEDHAPGYCHFPEYDPEYFRQLTAEHLVPVTNKKTRRVRYEWQIQAGRQNHVLDARVYARAAVAQLGLDRAGGPAPHPQPAQPPPVDRSDDSARKPRQAPLEPGRGGRRPWFSGRQSRGLHRVR